MRGLAREALSYGSQGQHVDTKNYAVTVILNPVRSRRKFIELRLTLTLRLPLV